MKVAGVRKENVSHHTVIKKKKKSEYHTGSPAVKMAVHKWPEVRQDHAYSSVIGQMLHQEGDMTLGEATSG